MSIDVRDEQSRWTAEHCRMDYNTYSAVATFIPEWNQPAVLVTAIACRGIRSTYLARDAVRMVMMPERVMNVNKSV